MRKETNRWYYTPAEIAPILHWDPQYIREVARMANSTLPFPVIVHGRRTQIPKKEFDEWVRAHVM